MPAQPVPASEKQSNFPQEAVDEALKDLNLTPVPPLGSVSAGALQVDDTAADPVASVQTNGQAGVPADYVGPIDTDAPLVNPPPPAIQAPAPTVQAEPGVEEATDEIVPAKPTLAIPTEPAVTQPPAIPAAAPVKAEVKTGTGQSVEDVLLNQNAITAEQLEQARAESANTGKDIVEVLQDREMVPEEILAKAKAQYYNIDFVKLSEVGVAPEALNTINEGIAQRYAMLPFAVDKQSNLLSVAMANPLDLRAIDFVEKKTGFRIKPYLTPKQDLSAVISERYTQSLSSEVSEALKETNQATKKVVDVRNLGEVIREAPIAKIVETLLTFAMKARASDIHIEPQESKTRVRYRIDGILHEKLVLPKGVHDAVVSRIKILADLKIDEKRLPQDGRFSFAMGTEEVDLRVSTLPTVNGEKVVMRLLQKSVKAPRLDELGLTGGALKSLETAVTVPNGIILITGPTGSGKTTTLYSILNKINTPKVNIVTVEDPVEYEIPGVNQVQVNNKAGLTFASGLRSFLRQDPNIIMVGEIRDKETTDLAIQASLTGHLVFSTLHTNSASGAFPRLMDMGAEPFLLSSSMTCVVAQRVVRKICPHCKEEYHPDQKVIDDMVKVMGAILTGYLTQRGITLENLVIFRSEGCPECNDTGYSGRIGIFEVLPVSEKIGKLILENASARELEKQALTEGMLLMKVDGYKKVLDGMTTIEEVLRVAEVSESVTAKETVNNSKGADHADTGTT
jgi:type IV pilus assembly protein PilB